MICLIQYHLYSPFQLCIQSLSEFEWTCYIISIYCYIYARINIRWNAKIVNKGTCLMPEACWSLIDFYFSFPLFKHTHRHHIGRLGLSVSTGRLCYINQKIFGKLILVNINIDNNWRSSNTGNKCWVSLHTNVVFYVWTIQPYYHNLIYVWFERYYTRAILIVLILNGKLLLFYLLLL